MKLFCSANLIIKGLLLSGIRAIAVRFFFFFKHPAVGLSAASKSLLKIKA